MREAIKAKAEERSRWGYRRIIILLRREGWRDNWKRIYRIYRAAGLQVRRRKRKRTAHTRKQPMIVPAGPNKRWSMDFMSDQLGNGKRIRSLNIVDDYTRECLHIEVDTSIPSQRVIQVLEWLKDLHGLPEQIVMDNGTEFTSLEMDKWFFGNQGTTACFIDPGKPNQNAFVESFNSKFRDECLNQNWFYSLEDAQMIVEAWRVDYNTVRPHSSLGNQTPEEFARSQGSLRSAPPPSGCPGIGGNMLTTQVAGLT